MTKKQKKIAKKLLKRIELAVEGRSMVQDLTVVETINDYSDFLNACLTARECELMSESKTKLEENKLDSNFSEK